MVARKPLNLSAIADAFDISRPAISQQIKILEECGLVHILQKGREKYCTARPEALTEVWEWVDTVSRYWNDKLDTLEDFLDNEDK